MRQFLPHVLIWIFKKKIVSHNFFPSICQTETVEEPVDEDAEAAEEPEKEADEEEAEVEEEEEDKDKPKTKKVRISLKYCNFNKVFYKITKCLTLIYYDLSQTNSGS